MSKNLTLKGAAFGALVALSVAAVAPANAVVNDSAVSLVPTTGTQYSIVQDNVFDLKSDQSLAAVAGSGNLKFLVTDSASKTLFDYDADTAASADTLLSISNLAATGKVVTLAVTAVGATATDVDTFTLTDKDGGDDIFAGLAVGDLVEIGAAAGAGTLTSLNRIATVTALTDADSDGTATVVTIQAATSLTAAANDGDFSAGTLIERTSSTDLESRSYVTAKTLGHAALTGLVAPTRAADGSYVIDTGASDATKTDVLRLVSTAEAGTSVTATVTAWIDENGNGTIENTEDSSSTRTVVFTPWASSGYALNLTQPVAGDASWAGNISFNSDINVAQITDGRLTVGLGRVSNGVILDGASTTVVSAGAFTTGDATQYNSTKNYWEIENGSGTVNVGHTYGATTVRNDAASTLVVTGEASPALDTFVLADTANAFGHIVVGDVLKVTTAITTAGRTIPTGNYSVTAASEGSLTFKGDTSVATATSAQTTAGVFSVEKFATGVTYAAQILLDGSTLGSIVYKAVGSATADAVAAPTIAASENVVAGSDWKIRTGTKDITVTAALTKAGTAVAAGVAATVTITKVALDSTSVVTAGGKTLTSTGTSITYETTTNADGKVVIAINNSGAIAADQIQVAVAHFGVTSATKAFVWGAPTAANSVLSVNSTTAGIAKGGSVALNWNLVDEFGKVQTGDYRLSVDTHTSKVGGASVLTPVSLTNGTGSLTITDASTATGSYTVVATLEKLNTATLAYDTYGSPETTTTTVYVVDNATATAVSATATATTAAGTLVAVETVAGKAIDARSDANVARANVPAYSATEYYTVTGQITNSNSIAVPGQKVTLSGTNLLFQSETHLYTVGSVVVEADASGNYTVKVRSNKTGKQTLTVKTGSVSKDVVVEFDPALATAGKTLTIVGPATTLPGRTVTFSGSLVDAFGNAVDTTTLNATLALTYVGPGIVVATPAVDTDANGAFSFSVLLGAGDSGSGVATATYDVDSTSTTVAVVTATSTTVVALPEPSAIVNVVGHRVYVKFNDAKGEEVSAVIGGVRITKTATYSGYVISKLIKKAGKVAVKAYVAGDLVKASTVTVK